MALYDPVNGVYRKVSKKHDPVEGVYRKVKKAYDPLDGVYRQYYSGDTPVGTLAVGDSVWLNVNGVQTEFLVVHQGNPDSALYDASCDGTWLLMKDLYENRMWDNSNNSYKASIIHSYLNSTFLNLFDADIKAQIKTVKIPYVNGTGSSAVASGSSGLSAQIFLLSGYEVGWTKSTNKYFPEDGACLSYFSGTAKNDSKRIAKLKRSDANWWLRSPYTDKTAPVWYVFVSGTHSSAYCSYPYGIRPALILDSDTPIDQSTGINIIV